MKLIRELTAAAKEILKSSKQTDFRELAEGTGIGLQVGIATIIGLAIGVWLDSSLGTFPYLALVFLVMGVAAGFLNYYRFIRKQQEQEKKKK